MKKRLSLMLSAVLLVLTVLTGCGNSSVSQLPAVTQAVVAATQASSSGGTSKNASSAQAQSQTKASANAAQKQADSKNPSESTPEESTTEEYLPEDGTYQSKEEVALYLHLYNHLPSNYITKKEAQNLGWSGGSLEPYAPGKAIGGSRFGNYEGLLPEKKGRQYYECDIDTVGQKKRGAKRIVWSDDGLIYYTEDHYESFELLYGEAETEATTETGEKKHDNR